MDAELSVQKIPGRDAIIIYITGGGLICGNGLFIERVCLHAGGETKIPVYAFSYRLAPEDKFPAAVERHALPLIRQF